MAKSVIYTRTGDKGMTSLVGGERVSKTDARLESYGTIDELNSFIGLLMVEINDGEALTFLNKIQHKLFTVGSYLATNQESTTLRIESKVTRDVIEEIEKEIDRIDEKLPKLDKFILPGGSRAASLAHVCRTVARRAERQIYRVRENTTVENEVLEYVNRLSDYFFLLARECCIRDHGKEIYWNSACK